VPGTISEAIAQFAWWAAPPWGDQGVVMRNIKTQVPGTFIVRSPKINKCGSVYVAPIGTHPATTDNDPEHNLSGEELLLVSFQVIHMCCHDKFTFSS
jgi:hypothetical protein